MRWLFLLTVIPTLVLCFTAQDHEIFTLRDAVIKDLGEDTTFYSWLGIPSNADPSTINKAYRKLSREIHPDKNPSNEATERFARLGLVNKILRSDGRDRYDFYLKKGFPAYREGSYLFSRFRPGVLFAIAFTLVAITAVHLIVRKVDASRKRKFLQNLVDEATERAKEKYGVVSVPTKVTLDNGKSFTVYPDGEVCFVHNGEEHPVDVTSIAEPRVTDTVFFLLVAKLQGKPPAAAEPVTPKKPAAKPKKPEATEKKGATRRRPAAAHGKAKLF